MLKAKVVGVREYINYIGVGWGGGHTTSSELVSNILPSPVMFC